MKIPQRIKKSDGKHRLTVPSVVDDSSGNNDLCASSDLSNTSSGGDNSVSEGIILSIKEKLESIYQSHSNLPFAVGKRITVSNPIKATQNSHTKWEKREKKLDRLAFKKFKVKV